MLQLLHLCDSLFPIGGFAYSDGLETAAVRRTADDDARCVDEAADLLQAWVDVVLDESFGRCEGPALALALAMARRGELGPALPVAFAGACTCGGVARRDALEAFAYTRLAATVSAAMRLLPIGQTAAHALLARALEHVPARAARIDGCAPVPESFAPAMDIVAMTQQYLQSRLFRS